MYEVWKVFFFRLDEGQVGVNITGGPLQYQYQVKPKKKIILYFYDFFILRQNNYSFTGEEMVET